MQKTPSGFIPNVFKSAGFFLLYFVSAIVIYWLVAVILSAIPVNKHLSDQGDIQVYVISNGVHSDFVLPVKNELKDWTLDVQPQHTPGNGFHYKYIAFGWGDREFYMETPTWSDLTFSTAFKAVFGLGPSAVHTTFYTGIRNGEGVIELFLTAGQYHKLVAYIENTFQRDSTGNTILIEKPHEYGGSDAFFEARGRYNLFKTCNTWTNNGLKACEQRACLWTPFDKAIFWQYRKN